MDDKILVVEDEIITAEHIKLALKNQGYQVVSLVISGEEAINKVEDTGVDLVLMDINLKGEMDGVEAAEEIWDSHSIPLIFLTAYSDEKTLQRAKITEPSVKKFFGLLNKPFKKEDSHSLIEKTFHGK